MMLIAPQCGSSVKYSAVGMSTVGSKSSVAAGAIGGEPQRCSAACELKRCWYCVVKYRVSVPTCSKKSGCACEIVVSETSRDHRTMQRAASLPRL